MNRKIFKNIFLELVRSRFVITYTLLLLILNSGVSYFNNEPTKSALTIMNINLFVIPLVCLIFGSIHFYDSEEFIQLLLTQPVKRSTVFFAEYFALSLALAASVIIAMLPYVLLNGISEICILLTTVSIVHTFVFTAIAMLVSISNSEKVRGLGLSIMIWLSLAVIYDLLVILVLVFFNEYPLEAFVIFLTALNPIDLGRIMLMLKTDVTALMGITGATYREFFGSSNGVLISVAAMIFWIIVAVAISSRVFKKKDF